MNKKIRLSETDLKQIIKESVIKILKEEQEDIERTFYNWAFGGGCKNHRLGGAINPAQWLYEYYYEDDDNALYRAAEEFSDEFGCDIDEAYEVARKTALYYFNYNPVYDENDELDECIKRSLKESLLNEKEDDTNKKQAVLQWLREPEVNKAEIRRQLEGEPESQEEEDSRRSYFMKKVNQSNNKEFSDEEVNGLYALKSKLGY